MSNELLDFEEWIETHFEKGVDESLFMSPAILEDHLNTAPRLRTILNRIDPSGNATIDLDTVKRDYRSILAILTLCHEPRLIDHFTKHPHMRDADLPFREKPEHFPSAALWAAFDEYQWRFCAHSFYGDADKKLHPKSILPFLTKDAEIRGGTAEVARVKIHKAFNRFEPQRTDHKYYALKTFRLTGPRAKLLYEAETAAFRHFKSSGAEPAINNIIAFFGGFVQNDTYHILLEYAEHGTLDEFFQTRPQLPSGQDLIPLWESMAKLLTAVSTIHEIPSSPELAGEADKFIFRGWHQDIKPQNILVLSDPDHRDRYIFKLADFGLSHFRSLTANQEQVTGTEMLDRDSRGTREYGAPECYRGFVYQHKITRLVGQKIDIWSLGAVYSEVAIWSILGISGLAAYRDARKRATEAIPHHEDTGCFHDKQKRLPCVDEAHRRASEETKRTDTITASVLSGLLPDMLCDQRRRLTAEQLEFKFEEIINRARELQQPLISRRQTAPAASMKDVNRIAPLDLTSSMNYGPGAEHLNAELGVQITNSSAVIVESPPQQQSPLLASNTMDDVFDPASRSPCLLPQKEPGELPRTTTAFEPRVDAGKSPTSTLAQLTLRAVEEQMIEEVKQRSFRRLPVGRRKFELLLAEVDITNKIRNLNGRDHIFLIDDSQSMNEHWSEVKRLLKALAWLVSRDDDNGMELRFLRSTKCYTSKDPAKLVEYLGKINRVGQSDINDRLGEVLEDYCRRCDTWEKSTVRSSKLVQTFLRTGGKPKKLSVYVLTNAIWQPRSDAADSIRPMVKMLEKWQFPSNRVGIQFIRFGNDPESIQKLHRLDLKSQLGVSRDIVDHTPSTGNLLKMIVGAIDKDADADDDDSGSEDTAAIVNDLTKDQLN